MSKIAGQFSPYFFYLLMGGALETYYGLSMHESQLDLIDCWIGLAGMTPDREC